MQWLGTEFIGNVSLDRQVRMQNVSGVGCDTAEELIIRGADVGDGRQIIVAVAKPRLLRRSKESRRARSVAEHIPDHAGAAYSIRETTVAWKMSCRDGAGVPCARSTRIAYSMRLLDDSSMATW